MSTPFDLTVAQVVSQGWASQLAEPRLFREAS